MAKLNLKAIEERVAPLGGRESYDRGFLFDLLLAYGRSQGNVTRLRNGSLNIADDPEHEVAQKNVIYFKETTGDPLAVIDELRTSPTVIRYNTRFVIVTDYTELLAVDTKTSENLMIPIAEIDKHFAFFLPWAGMEKAQYVAEAHADVKAAERMGKLFDELLAANPGLLEAHGGRHALNVFFTRLLFCFFAEDTGIFTENQFVNAVGSHTQPDGSDTADFLTAVFVALDTEHPRDKPTHLAAFPYVNGRLFTVTADHTVPAFTKKARDFLIELGTLNWSEINPDIFGSMFQAIVTPGKRSDLGQHYTSVPNILKTIEPLFLDGLKEEFDDAYNDDKKLGRLLQRIAAIKIFDPACGSGNFLIIAYKELRRLEHAILDRRAELTGGHQTGMLGSQISVESFYGIEIDDFAVEVAILSLWIAKHQMNVEFFDKFGIETPLIPLRETGQIVHGNATRVDWNEVCPNDGKSEIYLIGNPPYVGARMQTREQKADYPEVFGDRPYSRNLDYIALWFVKGAEYIRGTAAELAFVSTNSVAQGEHASLMFPMIFDAGIEIGFAYTSFKWENNAKRNAGVTVVVIGLRNISSRPRHLYSDDLQVGAARINGYLADGPDSFIGRRNSPLSTELPPMQFGNMALDQGALLLSPHDHEMLIKSNPDAASFTRRIYGSKEFIRDEERYCLWITEPEVARATSIPEIANRVERTRRFRAQSKDAGTRRKAEAPWSFREQRQSETSTILVPKTSSERRDYVPMGFIDPKSTVVSDAAFAVIDPEPWVFSLLTSRMHMAWARAVGGKLKTDYRYSNTIVYNNFPVPPLSDEMKERLTEAALRVLDVREYYCEQTLAELYDPDRMPPDLRAAHQAVDGVVDSLYSKRPYASDEERLSDLFAMYEAMTAAQTTEN